MSQDKLILIYTIIYTIIIISIFCVELLKEKKIKIKIITVYMAIIFAFATGFAIHFYIILFWGALQFFTKNYIIIQILLNVPLIILIYKILRKVKH